MRLAYPRSGKPVCALAERLMRRTAPSPRRCASASRRSRWRGVKPARSTFAGYTASLQERIGYISNEQSQCGARTGGMKKGWCSVVANVRMNRRLSGWSGAANVVCTAQTIIVQRRR